MPWRDNPMVDVPRSRWEWVAANWLRFAVIVACVASVLVSWTAQRQTIANRQFGQGNRDVACATFSMLHDLSGRTDFDKTFDERCR